MFRDTKEELARLERALLAEEAPEECEEISADAPEEDWEDILLDDPDDFGEVPPGIYRNYSNGYGRNQPSHYTACNTDQTDVDPEELGEALQEPARNHTGLVILVCIQLLAIAGVIIFWILPYFL